jgi:hypothetical protein
MWQLLGLGIHVAQCPGRAAVAKGMATKRMLKIVEVFILDYLLSRS